MSFVEVIRRKRDGHALSGDQIRAFIRGYTDGSIPDYQAAAWAMAVYFHGLDGAELNALTDAMLHSGDVVDLSAIPGLKVDKHSTGGVGDKISLHLAPAVAACGVSVPMISGRGLGHTGGTLDKLESIPGFRVDLSVERFQEVLRGCGLSLIGQTERLAPADKKLYALRDVTGTVESIPLISASIMSKKLAEGIDGLVLDVKLGSGAFMKTSRQALELASTLVDIGRRAGKRVTAFITNMDQPLGRWVGNSVEVRESVDVLHGRGEPDLVELTLALGGEMLVLGEVAKSFDEGRDRIARSLHDGSALAAFEKCVELQGGRLAELRVAEKSTAVMAGHGFVRAIDTEKVGLAALALGAGRAKKEDSIDPTAWVHVRKKIGERVEPGEPVAEFAGRGDVSDLLREAWTLSTEPTGAPTLIHEVIR
jgi:pyrimidine-nucleoside phosphorylase/thymidine phosphorylase